MQDVLFSYLGFHGSRAKCHLRLCPESLVIASELPDNPGTSVTNMAEHLATMVCVRFGIDPAALRWVERYPAFSPKKRPELDRVSFTLHRGRERLPPAVRAILWRNECEPEFWFSHPQWTPRADLPEELLTGLP